ncbi:ABC-type phosphate transport system substrate-binding protein [Marmoricola sp. OAE513]|uniref:hypothetical protein n=1 Tax=Marmoricola sp. OAE513 TaxID=2817894 RepID=UPI001AE2F71C
MQKKRTALGLLAIGLGVAGTLAAAPAEADLAPQPKDVVTVGSDIQQNAFNFLADGYGPLPGYNTAGNKWRFVNFDSSGDAQGRTAYTDPSAATSYTADLDGNPGNEKYVKLDDIKVLNPASTLAAGAPNEIRPSGGNGGITALLRDGANDWIDVARSPNLPTAQQKSDATNAAGVGAIHTVQIGIDKDLILTSTTTNAPSSLTVQQVAWIYRGKKDDGTTPALTWQDIGGTSTDTILPLTLPSSAGMRDVFLRPLAAYWGQAFGTTAEKDAFIAGYITNPNRRQVQQNDPTVITALPTQAAKDNTIVPFPRGRFRLLQNGYYINAVDGSAGANTYNSTGTRTALSIAGLKLLNENGTNQTGGASPFVVDFPYNAIFRDSDYQSNTPWQPGSTLNWVQALFYNPDGPEPFVKTEAGEALLEAAGIEPNYVDRG